MKRFRFKTIITVFAVSVAMLVSFPFTSKGAASAILGGLEAIIAVVGKISQTTEKAKDAAALAAILENTYTQITQLKTSATTLKEEKERLDEALTQLRKFKQSCQTAKYVYYAGKSVGSFYSSIGDYWNYAKTRGFSNFNTTINTVNKGLTYAQAAMRDAIAIANILDGKDEDGNPVQFDAATSSSRIRKLYMSINRSRDAWTKLVIESGVIDEGTRVSREVEKEFTKEGGFLNPLGVSFIPSAHAEFYSDIN